MWELSRRVWFGCTQPRDAESADSGSGAERMGVVSSVRQRVYGVLACASIVLGCAAPQRSTATGEARLAQSTLHAVDGSAVGTAWIDRGADGTVRLRVEVSGLPAGTHAAHIHAVGVCSASGQAPFASAGGHFNPTARQHGRRNPAGPHAGDLPNITVDASGRGQLDVPLQGVPAATGANTLFDADGSALVVHANADDEVTNDGAAGPGNSGARIACGVITRIVE